MSVVPGIDNTLLILGIVIVVAAGIMSLLVIKKIRATPRHKLHTITAEPFRIPLKAQETPDAVPTIFPDNKTIEVSAPVPTEMNCIDGLTDISQSLAALAEKYSLEEIALATSDGLLLASSREIPEDEDIARYCGMYHTNPLAGLPGIMLFSVDHKGSSLVGIAKTKGRAPENLKHDMIRETKDILNWWI